MSALVRSGCVSTREQNQCPSVAFNRSVTGSSGWNALWLFVPIVNIWFTIKIMFFRGQQNDNEYGASPYR